MRDELACGNHCITRSRRNRLIVAGGGVKYALAEKRLAAFAEQHGIPVAETQAGKGSLAWDHPMQRRRHRRDRHALRRTRWRRGPTWCSRSARGSAISPPARARCSPRREAGAAQRRRHSMPPSMAPSPLVADADAGLEALERGLKGWKASAAWTDQIARLIRAWNKKVDEHRRPDAGKAHRCPGAGRGQQPPAEERGRGLRRRRLARRAAQAVARHRFDQLPPGVRLSPAWATRSPAASASSWRTRSARCACSSATAAT